MMNEKPTPTLSAAMGYTTTKVLQSAFNVQRHPTRRVRVAIAEDLLVRVSKNSKPGIGGIPYTFVRLAEEADRYDVSIPTLQSVLDKLCNVGMIGKAAHCRTGNVERDPQPYWIFPSPEPRVRPLAYGKTDGYVGDIDTAEAAADAPDACLDDEDVSILATNEFLLGWVYAATEDLGPHGCATKRRCSPGVHLTSRVAYSNGYPCVAIHPLQVADALSQLRVRPRTIVLAIDDLCRTGYLARLTTTRRTPLEIGPHEFWVLRV